MHDAGQFGEQPAAPATSPRDSDHPRPPSAAAPAGGLGIPSGPAFASWRGEPSTTDARTAQPPLEATAPAPPAVEVSRKPPARFWLPAVGMALAAVLVGAFLLAATWRTPSGPEETGPAKAPAVRVATTPNSIDISSPRGSGRLSVLSHSWHSTGRPAQATTRLYVEVQLACRSGQLDYDPYSFQAFDDRGRLFEVADSRVEGALEHGSLRPGHRVRGLLVFALPRGDVTLLMTDDAAQTVTALRVPG